MSARAARLFSQPLVAHLACVCLSVLPCHGSHCSRSMVFDISCSVWRQLAPIIMNLCTPNGSMRSPWYLLPCIADGKMLPQVQFLVSVLSLDPFSRQEFPTSYAATFTNHRTRSRGYSGSLQCAQGCPSYWVRCIDCSYPPLATPSIVTLRNIYRCP